MVARRRSEWEKKHTKKIRIQYKATTTKKLRIRQNNF